MLTEDDVREMEAAAAAAGDGKHKSLLGMSKDSRLVLSQLMSTVIPC